MSDKKAETEEVVEQAAVEPQDAPVSDAPAAQETGAEDSSVKSARFGPLGQGSAAGGAQGSIDLLLDVDLDLSVELGRASIPVRDVLQLGPGSIVELEKLAGEPVDIMVNGKLVAKGEVVVVDENFGVRVTEVVSPSERLNL